MRGINRRFESFDEQWEIINKHSDLIKGLSESQQRLFKEDYAHPKVRRLVDENALLKARLAKMESDVAALQQHTYPLRPVAVKHEDQPYPPCS